LVTGLKGLVKFGSNTKITKIERELETFFLIYYLDQKRLKFLRRFNFIHSKNE